MLLNVLILSHITIPVCVEVEGNIKETSTINNMTEVVKES